MVTALLYRLFKPVHRSVCVLAAFCGLIGCTIQAGACCFDLAALSTARTVNYPGGVDSEPLAATVQLLFRIHAQAFNIAILFFGFYCILIGILAFRSTFLPRVLGLLMFVAGIAYVVNNVTVFLALPGLAICPVTRRLLVESANCSFCFGFSSSASTLNDGESKRTLTSNQALERTTSAK